jgi:threonine/homoserine/homoserine lactone efflux protein
MSLDQALAYFLFAIVAAVTPGPGNTLILATASAVGVVRGLPCVLGTSVGMGLLLFASALGLGQLVLAQPLLLKVLNWAGAAFLLWLAWKIASAGRASDGASAKPVGFVQALVFQWINPKGWLVAVGAAGTYLQAAADSVLTQALAFGVIFFIAALPSGLVWLALGGAMRRLLQDERSARIFNIAMAVALALSVLLMFR